MRVVIAPDKFKGSASAAEVARALAAGMRDARADLDIVELPVADGGDGTVAAALAAGYAPVTVTAEGPAGQSVETVFAMRAGTAVVELADVAGLRRLPQPPGGPVSRGQPAARVLAPLTASTYGAGQVIAATLDKGARTIVLGLGGSATTDGGAGMMQALGLRLAGADGAELPRGGAALADLASIDASGLDGRLRTARLMVASDVTNPLLGPSGAAAVFGPQKGASPDQVQLLDKALGRWATLTRSVTGQDRASMPGAGAAGGTGFAALAYLGADLVAGIDLVLELIGFEAALTGTDLVVTGEGSLDWQTLCGKAPLGVARAAARRGVPVTAVAGRVLLTVAELRSAGFTDAYSLADLQPDLGASMASAISLLERIGFQIAAGLPA
jgi:glycerate kinase